MIHTEDKSKGNLEYKHHYLLTFKTPHWGKILTAVFPNEKPIKNFLLYNMPPLQMGSDVNVTMAYMEGNNKCLCSHSAGIPKETINGSLMISMDVINNFTFGIYNADPWLPLFYSCLKPR